MDKRLGFIFAAISGACFGFLPIFAKLAYSSGGNANTVLSVRFTTAAAIMWVICIVKKLEFKMDKKKIISLISLGAIGYNSTTAAYFIALNYISTPMVGLIFYTNPIIVSLLSYFIIKEKATRSKIIALILSSIGLAMIVGYGLGSVNITGVLIAALAALFYAIYIVVGSSVVKGINPIVVTTYVITGCFITANLAGLFTGNFISMPFLGWLYSVLTAVIATIFAILTFYEGVKRIGPSQVAIISTIEPVVTTIMAAILFDEHLSLPQIAGGVLVIAGIIILQRPEKPNKNLYVDEAL